MGIVEVSGISFTTFQLSGAAYQWWQAYEEGRIADASLLTWAMFSEIFLREFVPQNFRDSWSTELEQLHQGTMIVSEYSIRFSELSPYAPTLVSTVRERVRGFIEGLNYGIRLSMSQELETNTLYQTEATTLDVAITSIVPVYHKDASVLFNLGSTYLYVSSYFVPYLDISRDSLSAPVYVSMPVGDSIVVDRVYRSSLVTIGDYETKVDLLLLYTVDFDVIFGMDWLSLYHAILDCHAKIVTLAMLGLPRLEWRGAWIIFLEGLCPF
ncbi:uncharacterized protein [Nicotiana tomentosiformis]|uniref:uncharacterized protein n=1 Tax=Nicotiana tomentosiformis TaxID=4098 RepID=UPI00388CE4FA